MSLDTFQKPISFKRHILAVLGANFVVATLFALGAGLLAIWETGSAAMVVMISVLFWLGAFVIAAPASGFLFTLFWPFLRKASGLGAVISCLIGGLGGYLTMWANHSAVGKHASASETLFAAVFGAAIGTAYWFIAVNREARPTVEANEQTEEDQLVDPAAAS